MTTTEGGVANRVRAAAGKKNEIIGYMPPTTRFIVIGHQSVPPSGDDAGPPLWVQ